MFIDAHGKTVTSHIALDASGQLRAGYRRASQVLGQGERISFDIMTRDAAALGTLFLTDVVRPMDGAAVVAAIRDARYISQAPEHSRRQRSAPEPSSPAISLADNSYVASALRTARYL